MDNGERHFNKRRLLEAVQDVERIPPTELIQACLEHIDDIVDDLAAILATPPSAPTYNLYACVFSGLILIETRSEAVVPELDRIYRDPEREPFLSPWFDRQVPALGPRAITFLRKLLADKSAWHAGRLSAIELLTNIAKLYPETQAGIVSTFRSILQQPLPPSVEQTESALNQVELWSWIVSCLVDLGDSGSSSLVESLLLRNNVDEHARAEFEQYVSLLQDGIPSPDVIRPVSTRQLYQHVREWEEMSPRDVLQRYRNILTSEVPGEADATHILSIVLAKYLPESAPQVHDVSGLLDGLRDTLAEAGVPRNRLDAAVKELLLTVFSAGELRVPGVDGDVGERSIKLKLALVDHQDSY